MKIVLLFGSPNRDGSTALLANQFTRGAVEAGHTVTRVDAARSNIHPCTGCLACGYEGTCAQRDGMDRVRRLLLEADMVVFATPLYYFGMSAQLKTVIDRFCSFNSSLNRRHLKSALLAVAWNSDGWTMTDLHRHYQTLVRYLNLRDQGAVLGVGCGTPAMTARSSFPRQAYELGRSL